MKKGITHLFAVMLFPVLCWSSSYGQISGDKKSYTVQSGDTLLKIAEKLGDRSFWKAIYSANTAVIDSEGMIRPGQVLILPRAVTKSEQFVFSQKDKKEGRQVSADSTDRDKLEEFRKIFDKVVEGKKEQPQREKSQDPSLQLGGFVLDETLSKMGRDFYNLFYQHWKAPKGAGNYTLTISEQPTIGRGTQVTIKLDYDKIFTARLQPRYEYIDALSRQAVAQSQKIIRQQASVKKQLMGY